MRHVLLVMVHLLPVLLALLAAWRLQVELRSFLPAWVLGELDEAARALGEIAFWLVALALALVYLLRAAL